MVEEIREFPARDYRQDLQRNMYWRRKRKYRGMFWAFVWVRRKSVVRSKKATARSRIGHLR